MKPQTRAGSLLEAFWNILIGYGISVMVTYTVGPLFHMRPGVGDVMGFGAVMTLISIARSYGIRRFNEWRRGKNTPPDFQHVMEEIAAERMRQIAGEGFTPGHDDELTDYQLAEGASAYLVAASLRDDRRLADRASIEDLWPVELGGQGAFKMTTRRRDLIKGAAMIVAEIGRLDREARAKARAWSRTRNKP